MQITYKMDKILRKIKLENDNRNRQSGLDINSK